MTEARICKVFANVRFWCAVFALGCIAVISPVMDSALAASAEIAKKCNALTAKAFPPRVIGNPAAGSAKGTGQAQLDYFKKCLANGGHVDDDTGKQAK